MMHLMQDADFYFTEYKLSALTLREWRKVQLLPSTCDDEPLSVLVPFESVVTLCVLGKLF